MSGTLFFRVVDVISVIAEFSMCRTVIAVNVETLYGGRCSQCLYHAACRLEVFSRTGKKLLSVRQHLRYESLTLKRHRKQTQLRSLHRLWRSRIFSSSFVSL